MLRTVVSVVVICSLFVLNTRNVDAQTLGAGTGIPLELVDTANNGPRINIDEFYTATLNAGTYKATTFSYAAGQDGDAIPFLASLTGANPNEYQIIALGGTVNITGTPVTQTVPFGGSDTFTLTGQTTVFAGFTNSPTSPHNPIYLDNNTAATTDHDNVIEVPITSVGQLVGSPSTPMSHANLGRTYAFSIQVVPEPTGLSLLALGVAALTFVARRSCKNGWAR
jgi:hypothetical protein